MVKQSDNEIYLLIKYIKIVLWRVAKCLSYTEDTQCLKVNLMLKYYNLFRDFITFHTMFQNKISLFLHLLKHGIRIIMAAFMSEISA